MLPTHCSKCSLPIEHRTPNRDDAQVDGFCRCRGQPRRFKVVLLLTTDLNDIHRTRDLNHLEIMDDLVDCLGQSTIGDYIVTSYDEILQKKGSIY